MGTFVHSIIFPFFPDCSFEFLHHRTLGRNSIHRYNTENKNQRLIAHCEKNKIKSQMNESVGVRIHRNE